MASDGDDTTTDGEGFEHRPVMVDEVVEVLRPVPAGVLVDATVGGAGHARAVLDDRPDLELLGLDRDDAALASARHRLARFGARVTLRHDRFDRLGEAIDDLGVDRVSAVLFDLGVSSPQFDQGERGFSYRHDGPLDMRMDRRQARTAADVVNGYGEHELASVLARFGDERYATRIARAIVQARPVTTTGQLADIVRDAIPAAARRRGGHPAKRTFQALRIEVNEELDVLPGALDDAIEHLAPRGRCAVLSYHSGEDRIVKERFTQAVTGGCTCPPKLPCACGAQRRARWVERGRRPQATELERNPRAVSARLRAVERLADDATAHDATADDAVEVAS